MQKLTGVSTTRFTSISDMLSGKIKTFGHNEAKLDMHYNELFSGEGHPGQLDAKVVPGTNLWSPEGSVPADDSALVDNEEESEDEVDMQSGGNDTVFEENENTQSSDPKPSGKRRADVSSIDDLKKMRLSDGDPGSVAGEERALEEVHRLQTELVKCKADEVTFKAEIEELKEKLSGKSKCETIIFNGMPPAQVRVCSMQAELFADFAPCSRWRGSSPRLRRRTSGSCRGWLRWSRTGKMLLRTMRRFWTCMASWSSRCAD